MQEKIQSAPPPEIKIFEGKPPPNSWVEENIVQYLQVQSRVDFLNDVLVYIQELQSEQLTPAKPKPMAMKESFVPIPEKGTMEDISSTATFNSAQAYVKTEMEFLERMLLLTKQGNPKLAPEIDPALAELRQIGQQFPHLTNSNMKALNEMMTQLYKSVPQLPLNYQRTLWNTQLNMFQTLMTANKGDISDFQTEINELQGRSQMLSNLDDLLQEIENALKAQPPSSDELMKLIENLQSMANTHTQLNPSQQEAMVGFFQQLGQFKNTKGQNLHEIAGDGLIQNKISAFLQSNPNASVDELLNHLRQFLKQSNLQSSNFSFMNKLGDSIEDVLDKPGFPATAGNCGVQFASIEDGKISPKKGFLDALLAPYAPNPQSLQGMQSISSRLSTSAHDEISTNATKIAAFTNTVNMLKETQNQFGRTAAWTVGQSLQTGRQPRGMGAAAPEAGAAAPGAGDSSGSLPWQFQHAILDHYMPEQEAFLEAQAIMLFIDNFGAEFGNVLLNNMLSFADASDNYNFVDGLHPSNGDFTGSVSQAKEKLSAEKNQCSNDLNSAKKSYNDITSEINQINQKLQNPNLTPSQRQAYIDMENNLSSQQADIGVAIQQLQNLQTELNSICIGPPTGSGHGPSKYFKVYAAPPPTGSNPVWVLPPSNWESVLGQDETYVINGNPNNAKLKPPQPTGGLVNIQGNATTFQQLYSDRGQNLQMILQMRMTEMQQEWGVVSTALQLLNQMYMTLAQAIYK